MEWFFNVLFLDVVSKNTNERGFEPIVLKSHSTSVFKQEKVSVTVFFLFFFLCVKMNEKKIHFNFIGEIFLGIRFIVLNDHFQ